MCRLTVCLDVCYRTKFTYFASDSGTECFTLNNNDERSVLHVNEPIIYLHRELQVDPCKSGITKVHMKQKTRVTGRRCSPLWAVLLSHQLKVSRQLLSLHIWCHLYKRIQSAGPQHTADRLKQPLGKVAPKPKARLQRLVLVPQQQQWWKLIVFKKSHHL